MPDWIIASSAEESSQALRQLGPWLAVLVVLVFVGGILIMLARRFLRSADDSSALGYTLHDLRKLHASGELSDEQFERAKAAMISGVRSSTVRESDADSERKTARLSDHDSGASDEQAGV